MPPNFNQLRKLVLRSGSVFYGHIASITSSEPHYIILLNRAPFEDADFALVVASSRVERVERLKKLFGENTIAEIEIGKEKFLSKNTYINCNDVKLMPVKYIQGKYDNDELCCLNEQLSSETLSVIVQCVKNSNSVSEEIKNLLP